MSYQTNGNTSNRATVQQSLPLQVWEMNKESDKKEQKKVGPFAHQAFEGLPCFGKGNECYNSSLSRSHFLGRKMIP